MTPRASVITATYNRARVLRCAMASVQDQTFADFEHLVVGDGCTDDTPDVVAAFADDRIRFWNLEENFGEQSAANNFAVANSHGEFLAFLNHDDLWLPDHLERSIAFLEESGADLVFGLLLNVRHGEGRWRPNRFPNAAPDRRYDPRLTVPVSSWVLRRSLWERIGPWRSFRETHLYPSQDWLYRAHRAGADLRCSRHLGVLSFSSGQRPDSYVKTDAGEHEDYLARMRSGPAFLVEELLQTAWGFRVTAPEFRSLGWLAGNLLDTLFARVRMRLGFHPQAWRNWAKYHHKGGYIDFLRRTRGLPPAPGDRGK
ncbi:MAG: glycosyltransferase [Gammaproteobacteria bacterium]|nr:glycosyltransferase [Gammaproteobacteria bacterium]